MSSKHVGESYRVTDKYAQEYLARNDGLTLAESSVDTYDRLLNQFETYLQRRESTILDAEFRDLIEFIEFCVRSGNRQSTIEGKLSIIGELYRYIRLHTDVRNDLNFDPLRIQTIDLSKYNTPDEIQREALSRTELRQLFDAFDSYRNRLMAIVGVDTGIRNSDIREIRLCDLSLEDRVIHISDPKGSHPYDVPIGDDLAFEIDYWVRHHRQGFVEEENCEYLFPSQHGGQLASNNSLNRVIKEAAERAGIQEVIGESTVVENYDDLEDRSQTTRQWHRVTAHTLRHSCITLMEKDGISLTCRQLIANHTSPETTLSYTHSDNDVLSTVREEYDPPR